MKQNISHLLKGYHSLKEINAAHYTLENRIYANIWRYENKEDNTFLIIEEIRNSLTDFKYNIKAFGYKQKL